MRAIIKFMWTMAIYLVIEQVGNTGIITVNTAKNFQDSVFILKGGDTLVVEPGTYSMPYLNIRDIIGTPENPIRIDGGGKAVIQAKSYGKNAVEIRNVHHLIFTGFEIVSTTDPNANIDGIKIITPSSHIHFDRIFIHDISGVGINVQTEADHLMLTNSQIANCTGSGIYWGYPKTAIVHDVVIKNNYIHHCPRKPSRETDYGIQLKGWSYRLKVINNVLHDVGGTERSGIIVYYGKNPLLGDVLEDVNIVSGNVLWNCRNEGITVMSDAVIENNIIWNAKYGINIQTYSDKSFSGRNAVENLKVRNNTIFRCQKTCINVHGWKNAGDSVCLTGNAAYQDESAKTAVSGEAGCGLVFGNVYYGKKDISYLPAPKSIGKNREFIPGRGISDFVSVSGNDMNFYPAANSALIDVLTDKKYFAPIDFNGISRPFNKHGDAGAYEWINKINPKSESVAKKFIWGN